MKNLSQETNFYKYALIPIKRIFSNSDKLKNFELTFNLKKSVMKYISSLLKFIKFEKSSNNDNTEEVTSYSKESIRIVNTIFKNGVDVVHFNDNTNISGFAINNCDISNLSVALKANGHRKINILYNLLIRKRSEGIYY
jgi:Holliday junction resolvasome RuvABC ATP-dependent DNA helicase subunit